MRWILVALLLVGARPSAGEVPRAVEIAPGVFVRDVGSHGIPCANQIFIVFDAFVVVFDPGSVPEARNLLREIQAHTSKPVRHVINSHFHPDHSAGAAVFGALGAEVVAAEASRSHFEKWVPVDFARKARSRPDEFHGLSYVPPSRWIDGRWIVDDGRQRLEVMHLGHGHTSGDLVGWIPRYRILLAQDLSTNGQHNLASANITGWIGILEHLRALEPRVVVPGHKAVAGPEMLEQSRRFLTELRQQVRQMVANGMTFEQVLTAVDIPMYDEWSSKPLRDQPTNVRQAYQQAGGQIVQARPLVTRGRVAYVVGLSMLGVATLVCLRQMVRWQLPAVQARIPGRVSPPSPYRKTLEVLTGQVTS
jgi:glyoxylase-like metal-dependent hydrolase (beta-lactamase superfamily II)